MDVHSFAAEDDRSSVCEDQQGNDECASLEEVQSDAIFKFLSFCFRQFSDYKSEIAFNRGAGDGKEGDFKHLETCARQPVCCPKMCGKMTFPPEKIDDHIERECPMNSAPCAYQDIGCPFQGTESSMAEHVEKNTEGHLRQAYHVIQEQRGEMDLQRERLKQQEQSIWQLTESVSRLKAFCEEMSQENGHKDKILSRMSDQLREQRKHQSKLEKEMKHKLEKIDNRTEEVLRFPGLNGYGEIVWRISNYSRRLQRVQTGRSEDPVASEPFYTSAYGYKIAIWAYINGRGREEGRSLSVYGCVMSSEYDAVLRWPIKPKYTFILMDQTEDCERRKDLVRTRKVHDFKREEGRQKGIQRPMAEERSIIVGFDDFITHEELEAGNFLADDCLFIRALVDISG